MEGAASPIPSDRPRWLSAEALATVFLAAAAGLIWAWSGAYPFSLIFSARPAAPDLFPAGPDWPTLARVWGRNLVSVAAVVALEAACWGAGRPGVRWVSGGRLRGTIAALLALGAGNGLLALSVLGAGLAGLLRAPALAALLLVFFGLSAMSVRRIPGGATLPARSLAVLNSLSGVERALAALLCVFGITGAIAAFTPPVFTDTLVYHLGVPEQYLLDGRIFHLWYLLSANLPFLQEMLYTLLLGVGAEGACKLLHWADGLICALAAGLIAGRFFGRTAGLLASAVFWAQAPVQFLQTAAMVELKLTLFVLLALLPLVETRGANRGTPPALLALSGVMLGFAHGVKYTGALSSAAVLSLFLLAPPGGGGTRVRLRAVALLVLAAAAVTAPWLMKNFLFTGNPVYPLLPGLFDGLNWSVGAYREWLTANLDYGAFRGGTLDWLALPFRAFTGSSDFGSVAAAPFALLFLPLLAFFRDLPRGVVFLAAFTAVSFGIWATTSQQARYLAPLLPAVAVASAAAVVRARDFPPLGRLAAVAAGWMLAVAGIWQVDRFLQNGMAIRYAAGLYGREAVLAERLLYYRTARAAGRLTDPRARVFFLGSDETYHCPRRRIANRRLDLSAMAALARRSDGPAELAAALRRLRVTHILVNEASAMEFAVRGALEWDDSTRAKVAGLINRHARPAYMANRTCLFEISTQPVPAADRKRGLPVYLQPARVVGEARRLAREAAAAMRDGDLPRARAAADRLVETAPMAHLSHAFRGMVLELAGRPDEAIRELRIGVELGHPPADVYGRLGSLLEERRQYPEALEAYREAVRMDPFRALDRKRAIVLATRLNRADVRLSLMREALALDQVGEMRSSGPAGPPGR